MELRQIHYFEAVREAKSALAASRRLNVSQPALSKGLRELEASVGQPLFRRHARGMLLTQAGERFAVHAAEIIGAVDRAVAAFGGMAAKDLAMSIGATPSPGRDLLPEMLRRAGRETPELRLHVQQGSNQELFDLMSRGALDAILCYAIPPFKGIAVHPLYREEFYLVGASEDAAPGRREIGFDELASLTLVLDPLSHVGRRQIDQVARTRHVRLSVAAEIEPLQAKISLVRERRCHALLTYASVAEEVASGTLAAMRIVDPVLSLTLNLIVSRAAPPHVERLLQALIEPIVEARIEGGGLRWQRPASSGSSVGPASPSARRPVKQKG